MERVENEIFTKRGVLEITEEVMETCSDEFKQFVFSKMFIIRCEHMYHKSAFEYLAYCDDFEKVGGNEVTPKYLVEVTRNKDDEIENVRFVRQ